MIFSLTSAVTFIVFTSVSIISILSIVLLWHKIFRKGFANFAARLILILLVQILILISVGIGINRSQGFYSSWTDLFGGTQDFTANAIGLDSLAILNTADLNSGRKFGNNLTFVKDVITGSTSQVSNIVYLVIPQEAVNLIKSGKQLDPNRFQVAEFLTGFPSKPDMWFKALNIEEEISNFNSSHNRKIIGVIPEINVAGQFDLECMNLPAGKPAAETWLTDDMKIYLDKRLGFHSNRWISVGVSTGGWCAYMFAINHVTQYSGAVSIAGYYRPALPLKDPLKLQEEMIKKYDVAIMESKLQTQVPMYVVASLGDTYSIRETTRFLAKKHPNLEINYHEIASGGHNPRVWKSSLMPALAWISTRVIP